MKQPNDWPTPKWNGWDVTKNEWYKRHLSQQNEPCQAGFQITNSVARILYVNSTQLLAVRIKTSCHTWCGKQATWMEEIMMIYLGLHWLNIFWAESKKTSVKLVKRFESPRKALGRSKSMQNKTNIKWFVNKSKVCPIAVLYKNDAAMLWVNIAQMEHTGC